MQVSWRETLYVEGKSYQEIGDQLDRHVKSIDSALQRIKRKLEVHLADRATADHHEDLALVAGATTTVTGALAPG